ncbi:MAG: hypothetical protein JHC63_11145, partial [Acidimicrobiia bacterium]|nr:hypothetical protein [Acidimicrobiia bacterium]
NRVEVVHPVKVFEDAELLGQQLLDPGNVRGSHDDVVVPLHLDAALGRVMQVLLKDDTQVYKQFVENESFRRAVTDMVFTIANQ